MSKPTTAQSTVPPKYDLKILITWSLLKQLFNLQKQLLTADLPPAIAADLLAVHRKLTIAYGGPIADNDPTSLRTRAARVGYIVADQHSTEHRCATLADAAALYGTKPQSLAVALSRGGGKASRMTTTNGEPAMVFVRRAEPRN